MKEFINKYINIKNRNIIAMVIIIFGIAFLINYSFFEPTYINEYIATNVYKEPANSYFDDENFYKCVIDAYNSEYRTNYAYTTNLSDEMLAKMTYLRCSNGTNIASAKGLEKMLSLKELYIHTSELTSLDVSKNVALEQINVIYSKLTSLDVSNNINLKTLALYNNQLVDLDVSNNKELTSLIVNENKLTNLNLNGAVALTKLYAYGNQLSMLDISENKELMELYLGVNDAASCTYSGSYGNLLTSIDLSNNTKLEKLSLANNQLTDIDLSNNKELVELILYNNQLSQLDIDINEKIEVLSLGFTYCPKTDDSFSTNNRNYGNNVSELNLDNNINLKKLYVANNKLDSISLNNNKNIRLLAKLNSYTKIIKTTYNNRPQKECFNLATVSFC